MHVGRVLATLGAASLATTMIGFPSSADTAPKPGEPATMTADPLPTWQTNGIVWSVEHVNGVVYVGGRFTAVRPPGAAAGTQEVARKNLAAFDADTGDLLSWAPNVTAPTFTPAPGSTVDANCYRVTPTSNQYTCDTVWEIKASPDRSRIYVGGDFTQIDGRGRDHMAAFSTSTRALDTAFKPGVWGRVRSLAVTNTAVYAGGNFTKVAPGTARTRLAAFSRSNGSLLPWSPSASAMVYAMVPAPDQSRIIVGGHFDTINGTNIRGLAAIDATSSQLTRWDSRPIPRESSTRYSYVTDLVVDQDTVYASANGEGGGVFDGRLAADPYTGELRWVDNCLGATWSVALVRDILYSGSHAHNCSNTAGGFPESWNVPTNKRYYRFLAETARTGQPTILHWFPTTNGGIGGKLGPRTMTTDGDHLWVGGEFTTVNGQPQQGLTRFTFHENVADVGRPRTPDPVRATSIRPGKVYLNWRGTEDLDNTHLTYQVIRDHNSASPIHTVEADSKPWSYPSFSLTDSQVASGTHSYDVRAIDPWGNRSYRSWETKVTIPDQALGYGDAMAVEGPHTYWRLGELAGSTAQDRSGNQNTGTYGSGVTKGVPGAVASEPLNTAAHFDGTTGGFAASTNTVADPQVFTVDLWFRTSTTNGGKLVGFGNRNTSPSSNYDRHVYMNNAGELIFGTWVGSARMVKTTGSYNDGNWHHVTATLSGNGMKLYVDGALEASGPTTSAQSYTGYWRIGGDSLNGWPERPTSAYLNGDLDEFAYLPYELSAEQVADHHALAAP